MCQDFGLVCKFRFHFLWLAVVTMAQVIQSYEVILCCISLISISVLVLTVPYELMFNGGTRNHCSVNPLKTKRRPLYLKTQSVPRCKHFSSRL